MHKSGFVIAATVASLFMLPSLSACSQLRPGINEVTEEKELIAVTNPDSSPSTELDFDEVGDQLTYRFTVTNSGNAAFTEDIDIVDAAYVTWRDSSIGCPRPGMQYMQVLTNGSRILLRANAVLYYYHSGGSRAPFLCAKPSPNEPLPYAPGEA